jgi:hypothetical protein
MHAAAEDLAPKVVLTCAMNLLAIVSRLLLAVDKVIRDQPTPVALPVGKASSNVAFIY